MRSACFNLPFCTTNFFRLLEKLRNHIVFLIYFQLALKIVIFENSLLMAALLLLVYMMFMIWIYHTSGRLVIKPFHPNP